MIENFHIDSEAKVLLSITILKKWRDELTNYISVLEDGCRIRAKITQVVNRFENHNETFEDVMGFNDLQKEFEDNLQKTMDLQKSLNEKANTFKNMM